MTALSGNEEAFCQAVVVDRLALGKAYAKAYGKTDMTPRALDNGGRRVSKKPEVAARIKVLSDGATEAAIQATGFTLAHAMAEAEADRQLAVTNGQGSAAVAATALKSKLAGHLVERKEVTTRNGLDDMDMKGLEAVKHEVEARISRMKDADDISGQAEVKPPQLRRLIA